MDRCEWCARALPPMRAGEFVPLYRFCNIVCERLWSVARPQLWLFGLSPIQLKPIPVERWSAFLAGA